MRYKTIFMVLLTLLCPGLAHALSVEECSARFFAHVNPYIDSDPRLFIQRINPLIEMCPDSSPFLLFQRQFAWAALGQPEKALQDLNLSIARSHAATGERDIVGLSDAYYAKLLFETQLKYSDDVLCATAHRAAHYFQLKKKRSDLSNGQEEQYLSNCFDAQRRYCRVRRID